MASSRLACQRGIAGLIVLEPTFDGVVHRRHGVMLTWQAPTSATRRRHLHRGHNVWCVGDELVAWPRPIFAFLLLSDPTQAGWQVKQAPRRLVGGLLGHGLGAGQQKLGYLPLAHTDSIFAVIGEEVGLVGCLIVIVLFALLAYRGFKIAAQAPDVFGALLATGATSWILFEAAFNIAAMTGLAPFSGIPLPFVSYGGSALVSAMGPWILLSVSRGTRRTLRTRQNGATFDLGRRDRRPRLSRVGGR
jgi:hypothetical protein